MERSNITKWLLLGLAIFLFWTVGKKAIFGPSASAPPPAFVPDYTAEPAAAPGPGELCAIDGGAFQAQLSTKGASVVGYTVTGSHYTDPREEHAGQAFQLRTNWDTARNPLRTDLHLPGGAAQQVAYDDLDWKLTAQDGKSCTFTYTDDSTSLTKVVSATGRPYELAVDLKVQNLAGEPKKHRLSFEESSVRGKKDVDSGFLRRQSALMTETMARTAAKTEKQGPSDFEPDSFKKKEFTPELWRRTEGDTRFVAVNSSYFTQLAIPLEGPGAPAAETRIEEYRDPANLARYPEKDKDPSLTHTYRARLAYPEVELQPKQSVEYKVLTYAGPKERDLLSSLGHDATEVLNLGMFAPIARALVWYLYKLYGLAGSWGVAIILLTITVRTALFPLSLTQIKSSIAMRKLKPEMDAINEKFKDDATQRGLAIQELWRKNGITNPVLGCLPMLLQMPVWWALYSSLQTAVELYHVPFGPFIPDLAAPGKYFIIPIVLGASSFFQQKMMPQQGDPQQQKMMLYMMPAMFTFMMLFLPAGLGVYMLTNTWLGIVQQLMVERYQKARAASAGTIEVREKSEGGGDKPAPTLGKGKARVRG